MFSRFFSRIADRRCGSRGSTSLPRRPAQHLAAAGQTIDALESRVLLSTLYVDASAPGPTYNGTSWTTAYKDLQLALSASTSGDEIRIADGTYKPTDTSLRTISFALRDGVAIRGGYAGYGAADADARDIVLYPTVLSGDIGTAANNGDNSYHVVTANGLGNLTILDGVIVTGGNANGSGLEVYGGGLYVTSSAPRLTNCTFSGNSAGSFGGGMSSTFSSSPTLINCTFSANSARNGGGMHNGSASSPTLINCTFSANSARNGGGMYSTVTNSSPTLIGCTISGNSATSGGGMYNSSFSTPKLTNCIVWGNANVAIYNDSYSATAITYSDIQGGHAGTGNIDADPLFMRSPWTGPDGLFGTADDDLGDLHLRPGSPALDGGSNTAIPVGINADLAGNARVQHGTVDMGAYEGPAAAPAPKALYVDAAAGGANNGVSWADAFTSLRSALLGAGDGDTIYIADGTYKPTDATDRNLGFALRNAVAIYGGYAGFGAPDPDVRDIFVHPTMLSGDIGAVGDNADNSYHVLTATGVGLSTVLDGIIVTRGNANGGSEPNVYGGGLYATGASLTLANCTFRGNSASYSGGGIHSYYSLPVLNHCAFSGNSAGSYGGGMCNVISNSMMANCAFSGNSASVSGGGMYNTSSLPTLANSIFSGNSSGAGGGMYNYYSSPTLTNCTISGNAATSTSGYGGGMYNSSSSPTLTNCIVWVNTAKSSPQVFQSSGTLTITHSAIQGGYVGTGNIDTNPLFVRNPSPGSDGLWNGIDDDYGDLRLQLGSPCIDRGNNAATGLSGITTDSAGKPRFVDIAPTLDASAGTPPIVDMGAYEAQWACPAWLNPAGVAVWNAGDYSLDIGSGMLTVAADDGNRSERLAAIRQAIGLGRSTGAGIVSSTAEEDRGVIAALDGEGSILVRVALLGDVTLDERIDGDDYFAMDLAFLAGAAWLRPEADVNVDGAVDGRDYLLLDAGFLRSATATIPESASLPSMAPAAQQPPAGAFSTRSIADELLFEDDSVLSGA